MLIEYLDVEAITNQQLLQKIPTPPNFLTIQSGNRSRSTQYGIGYKSSELPESFSNPRRSESLTDRIKFSIHKVPDIKEVEEQVLIQPFEEDNNYEVPVITLNQNNSLRHKNESGNNNNNNNNSKIRPTVKSSPLLLGGNLRFSQQKPKTKKQLNLEKETDQILMTNDCTDSTQNNRSCTPTPQKFLSLDTNRKNSKYRKISPTRRFSFRCQSSKTGHLDEELDFWSREDDERLIVNGELNLNLGVLGGQEGINNHNYFRF